MFVVIVCTMRGNLENEEGKKDEEEIRELMKYNSEFFSVNQASTGCWEWFYWLIPLLPLSGKIEEIEGKLR